MRFTLILPLAAALAPAVLAAPASPPGFNVHLVQEHGSHRIWRGGAPRKDTLQALAAAAKARSVTVTLVDLRAPANKDDQSGKGGRLSPAQEAAEAGRLGFRYLAVSALDKSLPQKLQQAARTGDVYVHCMYGVNRTGFAVARYAAANRLTVDREGLGKRDWQQGQAYQERLGAGGR